MKNLLAYTLIVISLSACGAVPISDTDKRDIKEGKKALLETNNRQLSDYAFILPIFYDLMGGQPNQINIESVDGEKLDVDWKRVNYAVVFEPGKHVITASCAVKIDDMNRDVNDRSGKDVQWSTEFLDYTFEGGKKYRIHAHEYINGTCKMTIQPK
jgi:hypothetical protein